MSRHPRHVRVMSDLPVKADIHQRGLHVRLVPSGHQSRRNPSGSSARCLDFADIEETRPRAEDASRVLGGLIRWRNATLPRFSPPASIYPRIKIGVPASQ